jgi:O-antigen biosynthesis protein WbqP
MYKHFFKRVFDFLLSFLAIIVLAIPMLIIALAIKIDSKGPVFFTQKRVGKNKNLFTILKFRTMRTDTPHDAPTHELSDPTKWITKVGGFLRKTSLDELPQIFNIFVGQMSIIGPRPALWNQDDLIAERDKYGANDVKPGLTGWAQINGRDELEIPLKAKLDGEYVQKMGFFFDCKCFFGTIVSVLKSDGVVEGGTGEMQKQEEQTGKQDNDEQTQEVAVTAEDAGGNDQTEN